MLSTESMTDGAVAPITTLTPRNQSHIAATPQLNQASECNLVFSIPLNYRQEREDEPSNGRRRRSRDVYVDCMITMDRGFPLWIPSPNMFLPLCYRESGVSLGDVGVLTPEGGFDFLFNVFHEATHPINGAWGGQMPRDFVPFQPGVRSAFVESDAGTYLAHPSMYSVDTGPHQQRM